MHDDLIRLVEQHKVAFPKLGSGVPQATIDRAEASLGIPLPESYKWWLLSYGGGQIQGDIVYGLARGLGDDVWEPDIVQLAMTNERDGLYDLSRLVFCTGNGEDFFFDTRNLKNGEYPVFLREISQDEMRYAESFADFLCRRIRELHGD
jgi:antitoxin YobK